MNKFKVITLLFCLIITACGTEQEVKEPVGTQELDNAIDAYLEKNKDKNSEYWDFSDPEVPSDNAVNGIPIEDN